MKLKTVYLLLLFGTLAWALTACGGTSDATATPTSIVPATQQASNTPLPPAPTGLPVTVGTQDFVVWFPESLATSDNPEIAEWLNEQLNSFVAEQDQPTTIQFRLRRYSEAGGILPTLRSANRVAPGGLPDITLIRREDLATIVQDGLAIPLENNLSSSLMVNLFPIALQAGRVQSQLYAIPYLLEVQLLAYYPDEAHPTIWTFENILQTNTFWNFPAGRTTGLNITFFLQYLAAGGTVSNEGLLIFNRNALSTVLTYYEKAHAQNLLDETMLNFTSGNDYLQALASGDLRAGILNSTTFLTNDLPQAGLHFAGIPTSRNTAITLMNGWVWVVTAKNAEHQATAFRFIDWMMEQNRHGHYAELVHMLPSQRDALNQWSNESLDLTRMGDILANAVLIPPDNNTSALARAMQTAFVSVISGNATAQEALETVASQFGN